MSAADREGLCRLNPLCTLVEEHGGGCDPRPEAERCDALHGILAAGTSLEELEAAVEADARAAWGRLPS